MRLIRSWPLHPPQGRNHVIDDAERLVNDNYDYSGLTQWDEDIIHIDWDTAVGREDLQAFAVACEREPSRVRVAPVKVYPDSRKGLTEVIWNLKRYDGDSMRYLRDGEPFCHLFGFGMVYLPQVHLRAFVADFPGQTLNDIAFSGWHHRQVEAETPVEWGVRPVHLHYRISAVV